MFFYFYDVYVVVVSIYESLWMNFYFWVVGINWCFFIEGKGKVNYYRFIIEILS